MYRPSQTPRLTLSSERITPDNEGRGLNARIERLAPRSPLYWISKETMKVVVFQLCRSSHLCYTNHVSSQSRTRVKLNSLVLLGPKLSWPNFSRWVQICKNFCSTTLRSRVMAHFRFRPWDRQNPSIIPNRPTSKCCISAIYGDIGRAGVWLCSS